MGRVLLLLLVVTALALAPTSVNAQIPDTFTNLKVLPKDIQKPELVRVMRGFSSALGVRCIHCHAGTDAVDLSKVDFASDDKENKVIARSMMGMTEEINASLQTDIGAMRPAHLEVTCFTCHHGNRRPETLQYALVSELDRDGLDSTLVKYRRLREEYYGQRGLRLQRVVAHLGGRRPRARSQARGRRPGTLERKSRVLSRVGGDVRAHRRRRTSRPATRPRR